MSGLDCMDGPELRLIFLTWLNDRYVFFSDSPEGEVDFDAALHPSSSPASTDAFPHTIFRGIEYGSSKINDAKDFEIPIPSVS